MKSQTQFVGLIPYSQISPTKPSKLFENPQVIVSISLRDFHPQGYVTGWWYTYPSEKYDFVSWDDDIPN